MRVRPPVPGSTPSSGISGRLTAEERSSIRMISSQASANSYPPPAVDPLQAAMNFNPEYSLASSMPLRVSLVNLQKLTFHAWKVNFCKFTNETRNGIEDASEYSGLKFIAACNGSTAGGGYELALACDEIILIDDRSSAVSLPEIPLLGVLPGTGGLTRLTDKRKVRRDQADMFCTNPDGVQGQRAKDWRFVDAIVKPQQFAATVKERATALAAL